MAVLIDTRTDVRAVFESRHPRGVFFETAQKKKKKKTYTKQKKM